MTNKRFFLTISFLLNVYVVFMVLTGSTFLQAVGGFSACVLICIIETAAAKANLTTKFDKHCAVVEAEHELDLARFSLEVNEMLEAAGAPTAETKDSVNVH